MESFHSLLRRQWQRHLGRDEAIPAAWLPFLQAVSETYVEHDVTRTLTSRALELSSEELRAAIAELRGVLAALPDLLFRVHADDRISNVTEDGPGADQPALRSLLDPPSPSGNSPARQFWNAVQQVRDTHTSVEFEYSVDLSSRGHFYHVRLMPFVDWDIIGVLRDITAEKHAEETKRLLEQEMYQAQKMDSLGSLAGGVAHDFNNMLGAIMGYADLLLADELDPHRQKYLQSIVQAASRSATLTQKLLAFGRRGKNLVEPLEMRAMVESCLEILRPSMSPDLQVVVAVDGCPTVDGDPSQIHQVLVNLCLNAMEAMPGLGTLALSVTVRELLDPSPVAPSLPPGCYVELSVSDTGKGMTEAIRHRIFEPFFTTKGSTGVAGTGLGLSTAYGIIQAHHGAITVESTPGKGSRFQVFLPVGILAPVGKETPVGSFKGQGMILLVEDEPLLRKLGISVLESLGYEVLAAADGAEAIEVFRLNHQRLSAVLLDLKMPRMGGKEAFPILHRMNPGVPVIICTGYGDNEEVQVLLTMGAICMLTKPYRIADLAAKLQQVMAG